MNLKQQAMLHLFTNHQLFEHLSKGMYHPVNYGFSVETKANNSLVAVRTYSSSLSELYNPDFAGCEYIYTNVFDAVEDMELANKMFNVQFESI